MSDQAQRLSPEQLFMEARNTIMENPVTTQPILQYRLKYMEKKIQQHSKFLTCSFCNSGKVKVDEGFRRAFKTLSFSEQTHLFSKMCKHIKEIKASSKNIKSGNQPNHKSSNPEQLRGSSTNLDIIDTTVYLKDKVQYKKWTVTRITGSCGSRKVTVPDTSMVIDMHDYLVRSLPQSKDRQSFALECTSIKEPIQTVMISNDGLSFTQTQDYFKRMFKLALKDYIRQALDPNHNDSIGEIKMPDKKIESKRNISSPVSSKTLPKPSSNLGERMITLKLLSEKYSTDKSHSMINRDMLERERVLRMRDESFNDIYKNLVPHKLLDKVDDVSGFLKVRQNGVSTTFYAKKDARVKKKYQLNASDVVILDWLVDQINNYSAYKNWKKHIKHVNCIRVFPSERTKIIQETFMHDSEEWNYLYVRHHFSIPNPQAISRQKKIYCFYDQSVAKSLAKSLFKVSEPQVQINYLLWKFWEVENKFYVTIQGKCSLGRGNSQEQTVKSRKYMDNFMGEIDNSLIQHKSANGELQESDFLLNTALFEDQYLEQINELESLDEDNGTEYYTVTDSFNEDTGKGDIFPSILNNQKGKKEMSPLMPAASSSSIPGPNTSMIKRKSVSFQEIPTRNAGNVLKFRHPTTPYKKGPPQIRKPKYGTHPHWENEWILNPKGELINQNKEKIDAQNSVLKGVFKTIGRNLATGRSILSISLPVIVFGDDSNLSRLCNSYGYAPIFLEQAQKAPNPIERFKKVVCFGITATVLYLRMDKPFNPILGETYQNLVDGCPIYGEQISHHPPISSVFLKGRGYTLYGSLQAKVELSLNSASGSNEGEIAISFDNDNISKQIVKYTTPAGQLSGVIYGERKMAMIKKSWFYDQTNRLYCEFTWGKHKGKSEFSNKYADSVEGQLVRLKPGFNQTKWKQGIKKQQIEETIGMINGRWTGAVFWNQEPLFDTYKTFPYVINQYQALLESDVSKRKDLKLRRDALNMDAAQDAKEQLEQIQRKDRKLREEYKKKAK